MDHRRGRAQAGTETRLLRLADVAPTVLELLGLPQPEQMDGRSLLAGVL